MIIIDKKLFILGMILFEIKYIYIFKIKCLSAERIEPEIFISER